MLILLLMTTYDAGIVLFTAAALQGNEGSVRARSNVDNNEIDIENK